MSVCIAVCPPSHTSSSSSYGTCPTFSSPRKECPKTRRSRSPGSTTRWTSPANSTRHTRRHLQSSQASISSGRVSSSTYHSAKAHIEYPGRRGCKVVSTRLALSRAVCTQSSPKPVPSTEKLPSSRTRPAVWIAGVRAKRQSALQSSIPIQDLFCFPLQLDSFPFATLHSLIAASAHPDRRAGLCLFLLHRGPSLGRLTSHHS